MKEQFKQLREQALREVDHLLQTEGSENGAVMYREHLDMVNQRFAELIVEECMAMCKTSVGNADYNTGRLHCLENIKEHFGVEE